MEKVKCTYSAPSKDKEGHTYQITITFPPGVDKGFDHEGFQKWVDNMSDEEWAKFMDGQGIIEKG